MKENHLHINSEKPVVPIPDSRLVPTTRKRIEDKDYEALFAGGCCFHFALRLNERFGYEIRGIRSSVGTRCLSPVWCIKEATVKAVDIRGTYDEDLLVRLAGGHPADATDVSVEEVREIITARDYPRDLQQEILSLADWIVDKHERFGTVKPISPSLHNCFLNDIATDTMAHSNSSGSQPILAHINPSTHR